MLLICCQGLDYESAAGCQEAWSCGGVPVKSPATEAVGCFSCIQDRAGNLPGGGHECPRYGKRCKQLQFPIRVFPDRLNELSDSHTPACASCVFRRWQTRPPMASRGRNSYTKRHRPGCG